MDLLFEEIPVSELPTLERARRRLDAARLAHQGALAGSDSVDLACAENELQAARAELERVEAREALGEV